MLVSASDLIFSRSGGIRDDGRRTVDTAIADRATATNSGTTRRKDDADFGALLSSYSSDGSASVDPYAILDQVKSGELSLAEGVQQLYGVGGSPAELLRFGREASDEFAKYALGDDDYRTGKRYFSTAPLWADLMRGAITPEEFTSKAVARMSPIKLPSDFQVESFDQLTELARIPEDVAYAINAQLYMVQSGGEMPEWADSYFTNGLSREIPEQYVQLVNDLLGVDLGRSEQLSQAYA